jgi:hypothetical protein
MVQRILGRHGILDDAATAEGRVEDVLAMLQRVCAAPIPGAGFALAEVPARASMREWRFDLSVQTASIKRIADVLAAHGSAHARAYVPVLRGLRDSVVGGYLSGVVDIAFEHDGRWWVMDWKSNHLGHDDQDYVPEALSSAMMQAHYTLQYHLYCLTAAPAPLGAAARVRSGAHWGGVGYVFLRGVTGTRGQRLVPRHADAGVARGARRRWDGGDDASGERNWCWGRRRLDDRAVRGARPAGGAARRAMLESIDVQLAELCVRRGEIGEEALAVALATALTSRARREGHSALARPAGAAGAQCVALVIAAVEEAGGPVPDTLPSGDEGWWRDVLGASRIVSDGTTTRPLVLRDGLLQFHRYFDAERRIARHVQRLVQVSARTGGDAFSIITGGPGTGKTTQVAKLLVDLSVARPGLRVALAAPTGKAAARLTDSIRQRLDQIEKETGTRAPFPGEARTLHRLLGYHPQHDTFRFNANDPLDDDLVIVDEASMVDVLLLDALLRALKPGASHAGGRPQPAGFGRRRRCVRRPLSFGACRRRRDAVAEERRVAAAQLAVREASRHRDARRGDPRRRRRRGAAQLRRLGRERDAAAAAGA